MYKGNGVQTHNDGYAPCTIFPGEVRCKSGKGKTPHMGVKRLDKMRSKAIVKLKKGRRFRPRTKALCEIWQYQKTTELLIPKLPFL